MSSRLSLKEIKEETYRTNEFSSLSAEVKRLQAGQVLILKRCAGSLLAFVAAKVFEECSRQLVLIASDEDRAEKFRDDCALLVGEENVSFFGARPMHQAEMFDMTSNISQIETLKVLITGKPVIIIASSQSVVEKVPPPSQFSQTVLELQVHQEYHFQKFLDWLVEYGFERREFVESYGDYAVRGGIVDVFPYLGENPIRFEFFGSTIESIREFDVLSQRSIQLLNSATIVPALTIREDNVQREIPQRQSTFSLFDYLQNNSVIVLDEPALIEQEVKELFKIGVSNIFEYDAVMQRVAQFPAIISTAFEHLSNMGVTSHIDFNTASQPFFNGNIVHLIAKIQDLSSNGYRIFLTCDTKEEVKRLNELIEEVLTQPEDVTSFGIQDYKILLGTIHSGFIYHPAKFAVFTEHEIFGRLKRRQMPRRRKFKGFSQREFQQLKSGDYVVHVDYGIGTFAGLSKIRVAGVEQEVMKLVYLENDVLYVNLNFINRVQKFSSLEGHVPKLNKLGTPEWERTQRRAKRRIKDIARDLITLYAKRKHVQGFAFEPDTHWQKELEASFMYEDTPDQAEATRAVKRDMEHSSPMDRLICGDVGFGKTEVAVRAAFKAVMNGKQVAVLVPTTILALQHHNTFLDRLSKYTTRVENITRFKSDKEQKQIIEELAKGSIDIIIGTHRLLSKDIAFKDLGLLIIDEEHRLGVAAKEKLRQLKASVDTLTLTATPIPRTLHFSLMGARDLSLITTPPRNRLPIITEIIPASSRQYLHKSVVREAILKELHRGGQVYFVHDRVRNIDEIADGVRKLVPEARVLVAHGQMPGHELEKAMLSFLEKKYDVLVCTKIIEAGLDIPSVNTIIINRADKFGMAELYQLRGRVGRSNIQAYAYLLIPPLSVLSKNTLRRLQAIEEFTELGSGFNLAMRDLEIRGAGNVFGAEQSGYIMEMGFEMYERIVQEAVEELKKEEFNEIFPSSEIKPKVANLRPETTVESDIEALIPNYYIESDNERLDIYRRLYRAASDEELVSLREELRDRFGEYPEEVEHLFLLVELRLLASNANFPKVTLKGNMFMLTLPDASDEQFYGKPGDDAAPFSQLMQKIAIGTLKDVCLKQEKKELVLQFFNIPSYPVRQRLESVRKRIEEILSV